MESRLIKSGLSVCEIATKRKGIVTAIGWGLTIRNSITVKVLFNDNLYSVWHDSEELEPDSSNVCK